MRTRTTIVLPLTAALASIALVGVPSAVGRVDETIKPRAQTIAAGAAHTVLIDGAGEVWGVGSSSDGQLGAVGSVAALRKIPGLPTTVTAQAVDAGPDFTLVLGSNGVVYGTGANGFGQLTGTSGADVTTLKPLSGLPSGVKATAVAAGNNFTLVVGSNGTVYGTGRNDHSQLTGAAGARSTLSALTGLPAGTKAVGVDAGADFSVVIDTDGKVHGAGSNAAHQLSRASTSDVTTLTGFDNWPTGSATAVAAGVDSTAVLQGGRIVSVGAGNATPATSDLSSATTYAVAVAANSQAASVLAAGEDGKAYRAAASATTYVPVAEPTELDKVVEVAAGASHVIVRDAVGIVYSAPGGSAEPLTQVPGQKFAAHDRPTFVTGATVSEGDQITANPASWIPSDIGTSTFQWLRNGVEIPHATSATYTVVPADHGSSISVLETREATGFESGTRESESVEVALPTLAAIARSSILGGGKVGATLTATDAVFEPQQEDISRVWLRNGAQIPDATGLSYRLTTADAGRSISVRTRGTKPGSTDGVSISNAIKVAILNTKRPTISGTAKVGKRLKVRSKGTWYGAASYSYQWYRGSSKIRGATKTTYKLTKKDRKKKVRVRVSAKRPGFSTVTLASATTKKVR
ncbi:hypothetical protein [Aeromicrobium sp. P5_D10]